MKTTNIKFCGKSASAYAERVTREDGSTVVVIRVYDDAAGHYVIARNITAGQIRHVIGRTIPFSA
jgi:hypothetical protein